MTVAQFTQNNFTTDDPATYKAKLDGNMNVLAKLAAMFAPHQSSTPNMTITVDAGSALTTSGFAAQASQTSATITAPASGYQRIDRAVINATTGALSIITGTPAASSPAAPAITQGYLPCAQIGPLLNTTTQITNALITDERSCFGGGAPISYSGSAPLYAARAWVNFNGTGTVAIRASGNVTSITDNGTGDYTINFTTSLPDANYSMGGFLMQMGAGNTYAASVSLYGSAASGATLKTNSSVRVCAGWGAGATSDSAEVHVQVFR